MSGKLDQSLDEITTAQRKASAGRRRNPRRSAARPAAPAAPVGGVKKTTKTPRNTNAKAAPAKALGAVGDSKVIVSNLPKDVTEQQIKEYFVQSVGPIKRVELVYGPNSQSRGIANVSFRDAAGAGKACQKLNGLLVDGRPIKIEIVVGAAQADKVIPTVRSLAERATQPKNQPKAQPKSAATDKKKAGAAKGTTAKGAVAKKARGGRNARPSKKTAEELDSDMADYFTAETSTTTTTVDANAAVAGDAMEEIN